MAYIEKWWNNPCLQHLPEKIFKNLSVKDLGNCRRVSKSWYNSIFLLTLESKNIINFIRPLYQIDQIVDHEHWINPLEILSKSKNPDSLKVLINFLKIMIRTKFHHTKTKKSHGIWEPRVKLERINDANNETVFHMACREDHKMAMLLLDRMSSFMFVIQDKNGYTPLHYAIKSKNIETAEALLAHRSLPRNSINIFNKSGNTPFHAAFAKDAAKEFGHLFFKYREKLDIKFDMVNEYNVTPLHNAMANGFQEVVRLFLHDISGGYKMDFNQRENMNGYTVLHEAIIYGTTFETVQTLRAVFESGLAPTINFNMQDSDGNTILTWACKMQKFRIVRLILDYAFYLACHNIKLNCYTALHEAIIHGTTIEAVQTLKTVFKSGLALTINFNTQDCLGNTILHWACKKQKFEIVHLILEHAISHKIKLSVPNKAFETPLRIACIKGDLTIVRSLLDFGQDHDIDVNFGEGAEFSDGPLNCLYLGLEQKTNVEVLKLLVEFEASKISENPCKKAKVETDDDNWDDLAYDDEEEDNE